MPYSTALEKDAARDQVRRAHTVSGNVGLLVRVLVVYSAGGGSEGQLAHPLNVLIACLYVVEKMFDNWATDCQRVIDDPPRDDFDQPPRARMRPFYPYVFGASPLEQSAVAAAYGLNRASADVRAIVAAREKAWGARLADKPAREEERLADAAQLELVAASDIRETVPSVRRFASELEAVDYRLDLQDTPDLVRRALRLRRTDPFGKSVLDEHLPETTLALLFRAGIRIEHLRRGDRTDVRASQDPLGDTATAYRDAAEALERYATALDPRTGREA